MPAVLAGACHKQVGSEYKTEVQHWIWATSCMGPKACRSDMRVSVRVSNEALWPTPARRGTPKMYRETLWSSNTRPLRTRARTYGLRSANAKGHRQKEQQHCATLCTGAFWHRLMCFAHGIPGGGPAGRPTFGPGPLGLRGTDITGHAVARAALLGSCVAVSSRALRLGASPPPEPQPPGWRRKSSRSSAVVHLPPELEGPGSDPTSTAVPGAGVSVAPRARRTAARDRGLAL